MSTRSQALVPLSTEQQAAWRAVAETEKRRHQGNMLAEYPYAGAFFRCLNGSRRMSLSDLRFFMPPLTAEVQPSAGTGGRAESPCVPGAGRSGGNRTGVPFTGNSRKLACPLE